MKKITLPWINRKEHDKKIWELHKYYKTEAEKQRQEWENKWQPLLEKCMSLNARLDNDGSYYIQIKLERDTLNMVASHNDNGYWRYVAQMLAHQFEAQLARLNFSGLHKLAMDTEYDSRRLSSRVTPWYPPT
jgi:hypothetical protein